MIRVVFKNLATSEAVKLSVIERLQPFHFKFPELRASTLHVTVEMQNAPDQAGEDMFTIALHIHGGRYHGVRLQKSSLKLYTALSELADHLLERLNRYSDRIRIKERKGARKVSENLRLRLFSV
ncbi:MAG: hypothetical protein RIR26_972 [Pseudomonadota bacterium]